MENIEFYMYRYFLVATQITFFEGTGNEKFGIIHEFFRELEIDKKFIKISRERKYILLLSHSYEDNLYLCKFACERYMQKFEVKEDDIESLLEPNYPFVYVVFDLKRQLILIQHKTSVFRETKQAVKKIEEIFAPRAHMYGYSFTVDPVSYESSFWNYINEAQKIYEVVLKLKAPNLFGTRFSTNEFLGNLKRAYNLTETEIKFKNEEGNLKVNKEELEDPVKYASAGGGQWKVKAKKRGSLKAKVFTSSDDTKKIEVSIEREENILYEIERKIKDEE